NGEAALRERLCAALGIAADATRERVEAAFCAAGACDEAMLRATTAALSAGSPADRQRGVVLDRWCESPGQRRELLEVYVETFLTQQGKIRDTLITRAAAAKSNADLRAVLQREAERVVRFTEQRAGIGLAEASCVLIRLGDALLRAYERRKRLQGVLDYDDLVAKALDLLRRPGVAPWVLFKLDGGLDHILIDEAQDTNPEQWQIVAALAEE